MKIHLNHNQVDKTMLEQGRLMKMGFYETIHIVYEKQFYIFPSAYWRDCNFVIGRK